MKMRCVNPAGFAPKWLFVISMHSLEKSIPFFNYVRIQGASREEGDEDVPGAAERVRYSRFPRIILLLVISSSNNAPRKNQEEEVINMVHPHTYAHVGMAKHTLTAICRCNCIRIQAEPARTVTVTALLHFNFLSLTHAHRPTPY